MLAEKDLGQVLVEKNLQSAVIFGSGQISNMIAKDIQNSNINVKAFLDNNIQKQQLIMNGITRE